MTLRAKILLAIWGVVLCLLVMTFFVINYWTRARIENIMADELRANFSTIRVLSGIEEEMLTRSSRVIAESPRLRAVAEVGDPGTAYELSREMMNNRLSNLFLLTDRRGLPLASLLDGRDFRFAIHDRQCIQQALAYVTGHDVWTIGGNAYRIISLPVLVGSEVIGSLTLGFRIAMNDLVVLKQATGSDIIVTANGNPLLSTMDASATAVLAGSLPRAGTVANTLSDSVCSVFGMTTPLGTFLAARVQMGNTVQPGNTGVSYLILKSLSREVEASMSPILSTFGVVSIVFLGLTTILGIFISNGITRPIRELVQGTHEVGTGNYDYQIKTQGKDELGLLGNRFMEMSRLLKGKIAELDNLNNDLARRNADLDETVTRLRDAQEELVRTERLAAMGKLTAQLAHEINNPLHNIQSCLKTALNRLPPELSGHELIAVAYDEVQRMSRLIRQMLDISRASYVEIQLQPVIVGDILREVIAAVQEELASSAITLRSTVNGPAVPVLGSRDKLKQVFLNIIANARDAMPSGGSLSIEYGVEDGLVRVSVQDTGIGIPPENLDRIFDAFFTTKDSVSGVGLGLSVSYGIVAQHRGRIIAASMPGQGSTFTILLPVMDGKA